MLGRFFVISAYIQRRLKSSTNIAKYRKYYQMKRSICLTTGIIKVSAYIDPIRKRDNAIEKRDTDFKTRGGLRTWQLYILISTEY